MTRWIDFVYRGFHDVPRYIVLQHDDNVIFLCAPFRDDLDEYQEFYEVYRLPRDIDLAVEDWDVFKDRAIMKLGEIPVSSVVFDDTLRKTISSDSIARFVV